MEEEISVFEDCLGFDWDQGNLHKNKDKHEVSYWECEEVFFNTPIFVFQDEKHSLVEQRHYLLGRTNSGRCLYIVFTIREKLIRVISARDMSKKERKIYAQKENTQI